MRPEARDCLRKAQENLADARKIMGIPPPKVAARGAYYAAFHAAEGLIVERRGRIAKTHSGVRAALAQLLPDASGEDRALLTFLAQAYRYKELSDYGIGREIVVSNGEANAIIDGAAGFLARIEAILRDAS